MFGCRDSGYKSKNTNSDPQEGFAIHCSTSRVYCGAFLMHKAAACKWGKTSPKSWRSKRHKHSSCSMSLLGLWYVHCVWYQQTWQENMLKTIYEKPVLPTFASGNLCMRFWMWLYQASFTKEYWLISSQISQTVISSESILVLSKWCAICMLFVYWQMIIKKMHELLKSDLTDSLYVCYHAQETRF